MSPFISINQLQIGGNNNSQNMGEDISSSLPRLLNEAEEALKDREFSSIEVKKQYKRFLSHFNSQINNDLQAHFDATRYIAFPFKTNPEPETFRSSGFLNAFLDTLSILAFSEYEFSIEQDFLNIKINGVSVFGIYYSVSPYDLKGCLVRLMNSFKERDEIQLPSNFIFMILGCVHSVEPLEQAKIQNIVTDILGDDSIIKPLDAGQPKCFPVTSYIIEGCSTVDEAKNFVREMLRVD